jgi:hypothetical protein
VVSRVNIRRSLISAVPDSSRYCLRLASDQTGVDGAVEATAEAVVEVEPCLSVCIEEGVTILRGAVVGCRGGLRVGNGGLLSGKGPAVCVVGELTCWIPEAIWSVFGCSVDPLGI